MVAGLPPAPLYDGTKHGGATGMRAGTRDLEAVRADLGHTDARSRRRYAKVGNRTLLEIARRDLRATCAQPESVAFRSSKDKQ